MSKKLVIVESPTKAKTIAKFLGSGFLVTSSVGHVRDLPKSDMGVDIAGGTFAPVYEVPAAKKKTVAELKRLLKKADDVFFATDEDREGEAISWHLSELLHIDPGQVKRLVFHEITKAAIQAALAAPRPLDTHLVDAQQARRVLDRLVGYELSPLLWRKVRYGLSAGRVQSVAVHLIVERELARARFHSSAYADLLAILEFKTERFPARLVRYEDKPIPQAGNFDPATGFPRNAEAIALLDQTTAAALAATLQGLRPWRVVEVKETPYETHPYPPFTTSTLQQEANRKLRWSARETMRLAQSLYENGYITYMRTDSVHLSDQAIAAARAAAREFGVEFVALQPKQYTTKAKLSQEAHEAIRPAAAEFRHPRAVAGEISRDEAALYELIWKRTVASQMKSAKMLGLKAIIGVGLAEFEAKGKRIVSSGYLRAYVEGADDPAAELEDKEVALPALIAGEEVTPIEITPEIHSTEPPARYTEASLIKSLEPEGVGRPSTYATILTTITERDYVQKQGNALVPTFTAMIVDRYLRQRFAPLVDVRFTANMEEDLDRIASGELPWQPYIRAFYQEDVGFPFHREVTAALSAEDYPVFPVGVDPDTAEAMIVKSGKYGPYLVVGDGDAKRQCSLPESLPPAELTPVAAAELLSAAAKEPTVIGTDPDTGVGVILRTGRFGPYLQVGEPVGKKKPKTISLTYGPKRLPISQRLDIAALTPADLTKILSLPRELGEWQGSTVVATVGRFGPYIKCGEESRSLPKTMDVLEISLAEAITLLSAPRASRGGKQRAAVLKELGVDPETATPVQILSGRYGPYLSNGTRVFVSVPKDVNTESVTLEQAVIWLADKKAKRKGKSKRKKTV
ncbi:MAG: type I DNA topoisomerase [Candidatus Magasanikbacteria bacterium]|nr:type I DNA topoisomerase [Candidatus Magasanikbacteria bacterium]